MTITLTNNAPASALPPDVTNRSDTHSYPVKTGDNRLIVSYFATQGALLNDITVAGRPGIGRMGAELGHPAYIVDVELPRGTSRTIVIHLKGTRRHRPADRAAPTPGASAPRHPGRRRLQLSPPAKRAGTGEHDRLLWLEPAAALADL